MYIKEACYDHGRNVKRRSVTTGGRKMRRSNHCQSASSRRMQPQVFQTVRRKDAGTAPIKDYLHHESRVYIQITITAVISESSPFYCSDNSKMFICYYSDKDVYFNWVKLLFEFQITTSLRYRSVHHILAKVDPPFIDVKENGNECRCLYNK